MRQRFFASIGSNALPPLQVQRLLELESNGELAPLSALILVPTKEIPGKCEVCLT